MEVVAPEYLPDPALSRAEMEALQRDLAADATFEDALDFDPGAVAVSEPVELAAADPGQATLGGSDAPLVAGVDQAFRGDEEAVSGAVVLRDGGVVDRAVGRAPLDVPYVPGLLSFREGGAIVDALESLAVDPDLLVIDGSGRIHFRQAGIATHVGVLFDVPAVGVAKNLLCGRLRDPPESPMPAGDRVPVLADDRMEDVAGHDAGPETVVGYAFQSRQYPNPEKRHVNPLYVSPGHRLSAETAVDLVERCCAGYKLPEPTRLADAYVDDL